MRSIWWSSLDQQTTKTGCVSSLNLKLGSNPPPAQWRKFLLSCVAQGKTADISLLRERTRISVSKPGLGVPGLTGQAQQDLWPWEEERRLQQHPQLEQSHPEPVPVQLHRSHLIPPCSSPLVAAMTWGCSEGEALPSGHPLPARFDAGD